MSAPKPGFFKSDRWPRWQAALLVAWGWFRLRFRSNPGFMTAAVSGSIGLLLALILLLGGWRLPGPAKPEVAQDDETESSLNGAGEGLAASHFGQDDAGPEEDSLEDDEDEDLFHKSQPAFQPVRRVPEPRVARLQEDPIVADDEETADEEQESEMSAPARRTIGLHDDESGIDRDEPKGEEEDEERPSIASSTRSPFADDDEAEEENEAEPETQANEPMVAAVPIDPEFAEEPVKIEEPEIAEDEDDAPREPEFPAKPTRVIADAERPAPVEAEDEDEPFAEPRSEPRPKPTTGWKNTPPRSSAGAGASPAQSVEQSRAVETAVYAAPAKETSPAPRQIAPADSAEPASDIALSASGPKQISAGRNFEYEFVVTNHGRRAVDGAILSVTLPRGVSHPLGSEVEHTVPRLCPGQKHRVRLKVDATSSGEAVAQAQVTWLGQVAARSTARVQLTSAGDRSSRPATR